MARDNRRMQVGHRYLLIIKENDRYLYSGKGVVRKESPYYIAGALAGWAMVEITEAGNCLFVSAG